MSREERITSQLRCYRHAQNVQEYWCIYCVTKYTMMENARQTGGKVVITSTWKGEKMNCSNYRGISLLSIPSEVYTKMLQQRLKRRVEEIVAEEQAGLRTRRGTMDQIFVIRHLWEKFLEKNRTLYNNFVDCQQAFDTVWQSGLWQVLWNYGIPEKLVTLLEDILYSKTQCMQSGWNTKREGWCKTWMSLEGERTDPKQRR